MVDVHHGADGGHSSEVEAGSQSAGGFNVLIHLPEAAGPVGSDQLCSVLTDAAVGFLQPGNINSVQCWKLRPHDAPGCFNHTVQVVTFGSCATTPLLSWSGCSPWFSCKG